MAVKTAVNPAQPTAVYARTGKGVLAFKNKTAKLPGELKDLFSFIDGKASVADLRAQSKMTAGELDKALDTLEKQGYVKLFRQGGDESVPDFTEGDLDFTAPGSLLEASVREAAKAKAAEPVVEAAVQVPDEPVQASPGPATAVAEAQARAYTEAAAHSEGSEARIRDLEAALVTERSARESAEAESQALRRARNEAVKALAQAKSLAAEERTRAEEQARKLAEAEARPAGPEVQSGSLQAAALAQAQETIAHVELQLATERETREQMVQALREAQSAAEAGRNAAEMRLKESQIALQQAEKVDRQNRERLRQLEGQIETGRRALAEAEAGLQTERRTREEAAQALQAELTQAKLECEQAAAAAAQHAEKTAKVEVEIDTERRARAEAEAQAVAERESREKATQALLEVKRVIGLWKED